MANTLAILVKVAQHKVEHVQQELAVEVAKLENLKAEKQGWLARRTQAETGATTAEDIHHATLFAQRVAKEVAKLAGLITAQEQVVEDTRQRLQTEYAARERYTTLHNAQLEEEKRQHLAKVQAALDEAASHLYKLKT